MAPSVLPIWWCLLCLGALPAFDTTAPSFAEDQQKAFVRAHNRLRQTAAPAVANMRFMTWDTGLMNAAETEVKACPQERKTIVDKHTDKGVGLFLTDAASVDPVSITNHWFTEKCHHENIMWHSTDLIGCAIKNDCSPKKVVVCLYSRPPGTSYKGWPCSRCPATTAKCLGGLCATAAEVVPDIKTKYLDSKTAEWDPEVGSGDCRLPTICPNSATKVEATCTCTCQNTHVGRTCSDPSADILKSVRLKIESLEPKINGIILPVSRSLFNEKIWTDLAKKLLDGVNAHCRIETTFKECCTESRDDFASGVGDASKSADLPKKVYAKSIKIYESTSGNDCDGILYLNVYGELIESSDGNKICSQAPAAGFNIALLKKVLEEKVLKDTGFTTTLQNEKVKITVDTTATTADQATAYSTINNCNAAADKRKACPAPSTPRPSSPGSGGTGPGSGGTGPGSGGTGPGSGGTGPGSTTNTTGETGGQGKKEQKAGGGGVGKDKPNSGGRTTASLALMLISCICTVALLCVQSMAF